MSANTPQTAQIAGYTDSTFPDEIYFPRLRSMGFNTAGGNSSWKWHRGKLPYTYQIKTGLAPISENDIVSKGGEAGFAEYIKSVVFQAQQYAVDPYCIGFIVDNELNISGGPTLSKDEVERIYFKSVREALDALSVEVGRPEPMIMIDPASNGGYWMAYYSDVLSMHRMEGHYPATWRDKFDSLGTWGIDRPVGQFTFTMGNMDVGVAHYGLTMFLNQRNRAQGVNNFMRLAYSHPNNIAIHMYAYMKTTARPLTEFRFLVNKTDTTDYFLADYIGGIGNDIYRIHMGVDNTTPTPTPTPTPAPTPPPTPTPTPSPTPIPTPSPTPPPLCNNDGICSDLEDCSNCPNDCISGTGQSCGNGICEAANGENCNSCPEDCNSKTKGNPKTQYCCGEGGLCGNSQCNADPLACTEILSEPFCCGDSVCEGAEDSGSCLIDCPLPVCGDGTCESGEDICSCSADCGTPTGLELSCNNGTDDDCDGAVDCGDTDCSDDPVCDICIPTHSREKGPRCSDTVDNDCDGLTDGADPDC